MSLSSGRGLKKWPLGGHMDIKLCSLLCGLAAIASAPPAHATIYVGSMPGAPDPGYTGQTVIDFESSNLPAGISFAPGSQYSILQGLVPHRGYNPAGDLTHYLSVPGSGTSGAATLDFAHYSGGPVLAFSFYWGSIDRDNLLTIVSTSNTVTLHGSDIIASGYGSATSRRGNRRVFFKLGAGERLKTISFASPTAFEVDDVAFDTAPVPEPGTWATLLVGMFAAGTVLRRGRQNRALHDPA